MPRSISDQEFAVADILDRMTEGVVVVSRELKPLMANEAARRLLGIAAGTLPPRLPSEEMVALAAAVRDDGGEQHEQLKLFFPTTSTLEVRATALGEGTILLTLRDVTQEVLAQSVRKEFVSHASHELKSPVASLQALAEAVHKALEDDPEAAARFSERLVMESDRLGRLVNDLLDLSRLEDAGSAPTEAVDLTTAGAQETEEMLDVAADKKIELTTELTPGIWIRGDEQQIKLLLRNLLENAIRYTPEGGIVRVAVSSSDTEAIISVSDNGIGIPRNAQTRVFERFYRIDRARSRDRGGTGLGLAIVKHVAELHGGAVEVESDLGQGSTFTARFPRLEPSGQVSSIAG